MTTYAFHESIREGLSLSNQRRLSPEGTMLPLLCGRLRKPCCGLWTGLGGKASVELYLAAGHLWNVSVSEANGRSKESHTHQLVYSDCRFVHSNWYLAVNREIC